MVDIVVMLTALGYFFLRAGEAEDRRQRAERAATVVSASGP
jgi:hypothetical protein